LMVLAAIVMMRWPTAKDPVNETRSTLGSLVNASPIIEPLPKTKLATPAGTPASSINLNK